MKSHFVGLATLSLLLAFVCAVLTGSPRVAADRSPHKADARNPKTRKPSAITCSSGESLPPNGDGTQDVQVVGPGTCFVFPGTYMFNNINIYNGGAGGGVLQFMDNGNIDLWAATFWWRTTAA